MTVVPVVLCIPFGAPGYSPGPGFALTTCDCCKRSVWIGPKQDEKRKSEKMEALCIFCLVKKYPDAIYDKPKALTKDSGSRFYRTS